MANYNKGKAGDTLQNSKCNLCGDTDEIVNHIITECSVYNIKHDFARKVIHWELFKRLKFDYTTK